MVSHSRSQRSASSRFGVVRPPSASTLESLSVRVSRAVSSLVTTDARAPSTLFAAMLAPIPVAHTTTPRSAAPEATRSATGMAKSG